MIPGIVAGGGVGLSPVVLWTPANLAFPPALWFSDDSAVTDAGGGACSQWNDLSGNAWHFTQSTPANRMLIVPTGLNGRRILSADGTNDSLVAPSGALGIFRNVSSGWMFVVARKHGSDGSPTSRRVFVFTNNGVGARFGFYWDDSTSGNTNKLVIGARRTDAGGYEQLPSSSGMTDQWVMALAQVNWSARTITLYINGEQDAHATGRFDASGNTSNTNSASASLGASAATTAVFDGDYFEALCGTGVLDPDDIDKLFGYAAHRAGLAGSLDAGHPYKAAPPTSPPEVESMWMGAPS